MAMLVQNHLLVEQVKANPIPHHAELVKVVRNLQPVALEKVTASQKPLPVVPHVESARSKILRFPVKFQDREPS
ncbi:MAG TPA: hypothetical protein DEO60_07660 [Bacteroidales bacterium]|nr:hypothetical protein [Bacteroidales bacterium]